MATVPWRQLKAEALARLEEAGIEGPAQELRWIAERASGRSAAELHRALDEPATAREAAAVDQMVTRRAAGEPLQYVLGRWGFRTLDLMVDRRVLIPRPETEVVAGLVLDALAASDRRGAGGEGGSGGAHRAPIVVDLGTGSGAIALSVAAERWPKVEVWGTDVSPDALAVARANLAGLGRRAGVVRLAEGDWFDALPGALRGRVEVVVSNPPYVADGEDLPPAVADWEPPGALRAGPDGLDHVRRIVTGAPGWLAPGGALVVEIGDTQAGAVLALAASAGFADASVELDLPGRPRALVARVAADHGRHHTAVSGPGNRPGDHAPRPPAGGPATWRGASGTNLPAIGRSGGRLRRSGSTRLSTTHRTRGDHMPLRKRDVGGTVEDLRHIALFARMGNADLEEVAKLGGPVEAEAGAHLMEQGDVGTECFLVLEGEAGVISGEDHVATIGPGSIVGEMALIGHRPRNASVVAQTPMRLLAFDIAAFRRLLEDMPEAKAHIHELLEARAGGRRPS